MHSRLLSLVIAHVVLGIGFCTYSAIDRGIPFVLPYLLVVPAIALVLSQASLLGFWAGLGLNRWYLRTAGLIAGVIYLEIIMAFGAQDDDFFFLATFSTLATAGILLVARYWQSELVLVAEKACQDQQEGLHFSIRGLMTFTFLIAVAMTGIRLYKEHFGSGPGIAAIALWSIGVVTLGLAAVWAALGLARPQLRCLFVLTLSVVIGALLPYAIENRWETYVYLISITFFQILIFIGSLLVVRSCGFRLVRRKDASFQSPFARTQSLAKK